MKIQLATIYPVRQRETCSCPSTLNHIHAQAMLHARHKTAPKFTGVEYGDGLQLMLAVDPRVEARQVGWIFQPVGS